VILGKHLNQWFMHRSGQEMLDDTWPIYITKALESSRTAPDVIKTFGNSDIRALIGFIDLVGFSEHVRGLSPKQVADYLLPLLNELVSLVVDEGGLVDKTIGDEVMFVLPDTEGEGGVPIVLASNRLIAGIWQLRCQFAAHYPFRIGLALGTVYLGQVATEGYSEWSVFGETVNFAKRIMNVPEEAFAEAGAHGALGTLLAETECHKYFDVLLQYFAPDEEYVPCGLALTEVEDPTVKAPLKGISPYRCALMVPREPRLPRCRAGAVE